MNFYNDETYRKLKRIEKFLLLASEIKDELPLQMVSHLTELDILLEKTERMITLINNQ